FLLFIGIQLISADDDDMNFTGSFFADLTIEFERNSSAEYNFWSLALGIISRADQTYILRSQAFDNAAYDDAQWLPKHGLISYHFWNVNLHRLAQKMNYSKVNPEWDSYATALNALPSLINSSICHANKSELQVLIHYGELAVNVR